MSKLDDLIAELCPEGVEYKPLHAITALGAGDRITKAMMRDVFEYPVMGAGIVPTGYYTEWNRENCITISRAGAGAGSVGWHPEKFWATDVCFVAVEKNESSAPNIKFIYYAMKAQEKELRKHIYGGSMPKINKDYLWNLSIPVPP
ncbi:MAG TPA: restriction endonuclease subunit S, partial [Methanocorpusculum sp.]|nr:restriction endonuclease subunit S [Methanocorpusculum sp.]